MSHIVVKGSSRKFTRKDGEIITYTNYTVIDADDGNVLTLSQDDDPPGLPPDVNIFTCEAVIGVKQFNTKEGLKDRTFIKSFKNAKALKV